MNNNTTDCVKIRMLYFGGAKNGFGKFKISSSFPRNNKSWSFSNPSSVYTS